MDARSQPAGVSAADVEMMAASKNRSSARQKRKLQELLELAEGRRDRRLETWYCDTSGEISKEQSVDLEQSIDVSAADATGSGSGSRSMMSLEHRFQRQALSGKRSMDDVDQDSIPHQFPSHPPGNWQSPSTPASKRHRSGDLSPQESPSPASEKGQPPQELPYEDRMASRERSLTIKKGQDEYKEYCSRFKNGGSAGPAPTTPDPRDPALERNRAWSKRLEREWWFAIKTAVRTDSARCCPFV